jgi:hypothetical protein
VHISTLHEGGRIIEAGGAGLAALNPPLRPSSTAAASLPSADGAGARSSTIDHELGELGRVARAFQRFVGHSDLLNFLPKNSTANNKAMIAAARRAGVRIS